MERDEIMDMITKSIEQQEDMAKLAWADSDRLLDQVINSEPGADYRALTVLAHLSRIESAIRDSSTCIALALMALATRDDDSDSDPLH